ncbi:MAG: ORF6N domain-containing protein [Tannerellaceae bacterium]|nr:ORF6N domain-containing protein [Tannerellaceae bacterium]
MELQIIQNKIYEVRGYRVMLDFHLAKLYGVQTKVLKQAVKRNLQRFPPDFMFELSNEEMSEVVTICDHLPEALKFSYANSMVFTEQGVAMLSSVLRSQKAIDVNISIMRAFVAMRQMIIGYEELKSRIEDLERNTDTQFSEIYQALTELLSKPEPPKRNRIGYK